jgi:uncharacterized membrane protein YhfC
MTSDAGHGGLEAAGSGRTGIEIVRLLEAALTPVEPPASLSDQLEERLAEVQAAALEELADWELGAMRDPRNWARPAAAVAVGTAAGAALVVMRARRKQRSRLKRLTDQGRRELLDAIADARSRLR